MNRLSPLAVGKKHNRWDACYPYALWFLLLLLWIISHYLHLPIASVRFVWFLLPAPKGRQVNTKQFNWIDNNPNGSSFFLYIWFAVWFVRPPSSVPIETDPNIAVYPPPVPPLIGMHCAEGLIVRVAHNRVVRRPNQKPMNLDRRESSSETLKTISAAKLGDD